jgi:hypothetical protein
VSELADWAAYPRPFSPTIIPTLPSVNLTDDERAMIQRLQSRAQLDRGDMMLTNAYYNGEQIIRNLKIAIPDEIADQLRTLVGWPRIAVDPYVERLGADGFRIAGATDSNQDLWDLWDANGLQAEQSLAFTDALAMRRSYWLAGSPDEPGDAPRITVESPLNMAVLWDLGGRRAKCALQGYWVDDVMHAAFMLPNSTVQIAQDDRKQWQVVSRDEHNFGVVPIARMANNPRADWRDGYSNITPELMSIVDGACRTLLGLEVAREFYSVPQKLVLGASESDFQGPDGTAKKAWATYINMVLALERDDEGNLPEVKQLAPYDPSVFTKLIEMYASQAAGILAAVPQDLGLYTSGNPTSAEAAAVADARRDRRARRMQVVFGVEMVKAMQFGIRYQNNGELPDEFRRMSVDWASVAIETPGVTADAITKQIAAGSIPATSDETLKALGWSYVQRQRLAQDRAVDQGASMLQEIAHSLDAKAFRADKALTSESAQSAGQPDPNKAIPTPAPGASPTPNMMPKRALGVPAGS